MRLSQKEISFAIECLEHLFFITFQTFLLCFFNYLAIATSPITPPASTSSPAPIDASQFDPYQCIYPW